MCDTWYAQDLAGSIYHGLTMCALLLHKRHGRAVDEGSTLHTDRQTDRQADRQTHTHTRMMVVHFPVEVPPGAVFGIVELR